MSHAWIIDSEETDQMTENQGIMFSFTLASYSNSIVLADDSRSPIQGIDTANTTLTLPLSSVFSIYLIFLSTYYQ